jgi:hypothetical protein
MPKSGLCLQSGVILPNLDVQLPSACTIVAVGEIAPRLRAALDTADAVTLDLSTLESCDLSFVQLVEAGRRTAAARGKTFALAQPAPPPLAAILSRAGFAGATAPAADIAFWYHGVLPQ